MATGRNNDRNTTVSGFDTSSVSLDRRGFDPDDYPADPSAYTASTHFLNHVKTSHDRYLDLEVHDRPVYETAIEEGDLRDNGDGLGCFAFEWFGVLYVIVVGFHERGYRVIVTGWPWLLDREEALESMFWLPEEIDAIHRFNEQKEHKPTEKHRPVND